MQFIPELAAIDFGRSAVIVFWIQVICMGIFLPIQYRFGYEKTKVVSDAVGYCWSCTYEFG